MPASRSSVLDRVARGVPDLVARGLVDAAATGFTAVARLRHAKALHPVGTVLVGTLVRTGLSPGVGVDWLDRPGEEQVLLRFSRATGVPGPLPDVLGLAIRSAGPDGRPQDLLLSTTGRCPLLRHLLVPRRRPDQGGYTSVVPFRTATGPLMVGVFPVAGGAFSLQVAGIAGCWREFGLLVPDDDPQAAPDEDVSFDPVRNPVPGLDLPRPLALLRAAAYAASRSGRHGTGDAATPR